jgi:hypothetical protein
LRIVEFDPLRHRQVPHIAAAKARRPYQDEHSGR